MTFAPSEKPNAATFAERKAVVTAIREHSAQRLADGSSGVLIAATLADRIDSFLANLAEEMALNLSTQKQESLRRETAIIGVGGTGRGSVAPYSDVDLMILTRSETNAFDEVVQTYVQDVWDAGLKLGHSVRTIPGALKLASEDEKTSTSFVKTKLVWGNGDLQKEFDRQFQQQILRRKPHEFVEGAVRARYSDFPDDRPTLQQLQPNIKTSHGGLRDLHLISWIAAAYHGTTDLSVLQLQRVITPDDANRLRDAEEFLLRIRIRMHLIAGGPEETLARNLQLAIAEQEGYEDSETQRPVEQLMQEYFHHSFAVATIADRFVARHRRPPWYKRLISAFLERRNIHGVIIDPKSVDLPVGNTNATESLEHVLDVYELASDKNLTIAPKLTEAIRAAALVYDDTLSERAAANFRLILSRPQSLPAIIRHMHDTGVLDRVIPQYRAIRSLLQFNQYHDFTVDEHTLRAIETVCSFSTDDGPLGRAYRRVRNRDVLHFSVFLHDIGKGRPEDHSELGAEIALEVCQRIGYDEEKTERLSNLVLYHLEMADLAFRRDISDGRVLVEFANRLGSPRLLIKLYLLTAADIMAVGPGLWTPWKAELLASLFERVMVIMSGRNYGGFEEEKIAERRQAVLSQMPKAFTGQQADWTSLVESEFDRFPTHYLMATKADRISKDLSIVSTLGDEEINVEAVHDESTGVTEYRVILPQTVGGCFQNMCAVLTARNCEIFFADIATTTDKYIIDSFHVRDRDYVHVDDVTDEETLEVDIQRISGPYAIPDSRLDELKTLIRDVLSGRRDAAGLFSRFERFDTYLEDDELPSGLSTRVRIDNDTSSDRTIIDIFSQDRRGLLYFIAKSISDLDLSIDLAKIATHFDQVVDVLYVTDRQGQKLTHEHAREIRGKLESRMKWFDEEGYRRFRRD